MAAIITDKYRTFNVGSLLKSLEGSSPSNYLYTFIGVSAPWVSDNIGENINDTTPPTPIDCVNNYNFIWRNMLSLKRVQRSDISSGIKKISWISGNYYDIYRHDYGTPGVTGVTLLGAQSTPTSLNEANCFVVTENGNVYVCLGNNGAANAATDNPQNRGSGVGFANFNTSDGYMWKFIASVSPDDFTKFSTVNFHPVKTVTEQPPVGDPYEEQFLAQEHAKLQRGAIFNVLVSSGGSSAFVSATITSGITIKGDGAGLVVSAKTNSSGSVQSITIVSPGYGYTYCNITIAGVSGAVFTPIFTPLTGLGVNPMYDLNSHYALINTRLAYAEGDGDFTVANDYRQVGLIANPVSYSSTTLANSATLDATHSLTLNTPSAFFINDSLIVCSNGSTGKIVDWNPTSKILRVNLAKPADISNWENFVGFGVGQTISQVGGDGSTQNVAITEYIPPEVASHSGEILYFENRRPILRDISQVEVLNIAVEY